MRTNQLLLPRYTGRRDPVAKRLDPCCEPLRPLGRDHQLRSGDHARMRTAAPPTGAARPPGRTPYRDSLSRRDHRADAQLPVVTSRLTARPDFGLAWVCAWKMNALKSGPFRVS